MSSDAGLTAREFFNQLLLPDFPGGFEDPKWRSLRTQGVAFNKLTACGIKRLKAGDWYGEGILLPRQSGSKSERIEARLWDALNIHLYDGTVFGHSIEYAGVLFYKAKPEPKKTGAKVPRKAASSKDVEKWLRSIMVEGQPNVVKMQKAAQKHFDPKVVLRDILRPLHKKIKAEQTKTPLR